MTTVTALQRMEALERANTIRLEGAEFKRELASKPMREGLEALADYLQHEPSLGVGAVPVNKLVASIQRVGGNKAGVILRDALLPHRRNVRLRVLTDVERARVCKALRSWPRPKR